jgi:hypothetical protein
MECAWEILDRFSQALLAVEHEIKFITFAHNSKRWVFYFRPQLFVVQPLSLTIDDRPRLKSSFAGENPLDAISSGAVEEDRDDCIANR